MLSKEENERLTQVGPGTPGGELLRRYWQPIAIASELTAEQAEEARDASWARTGGLPRRAGQLRLRGGALRPPRRVAVLRLRRGLRASVAPTTAGSTPPPTGSAWSSRSSRRAAPTRTASASAPIRCRSWRACCSSTWAPQPRAAAAALGRAGARGRRAPIQTRSPLDCNWLQAQENTADTAHTYYLHGHMLTLQGRAATAPTSTGRSSSTTAGSASGASRRLCTTAASSPRSEIRPPLIFPNILRIPQGPRRVHALARADRRHPHADLIMVGFTPSPDGAPRGAAGRPADRLPAAMAAPDGEYDLTDVLRARTAWRGRRRARSTTAAQEHLGASDRGIVMFRQLLRRADHGRRAAAASRWRSCATPRRTASSPSTTRPRRS